MLNLRGLATSVHYNITIPEAAAIGDPNQPSPVYLCVIPPCYFLFSGHSLSCRTSCQHRAIKIAKYPFQKTPSALLLCFLPVTMVMPGSRSDCLSRLGPGSRIWPSSPGSSSTSRRDAQHGCSNGLLSFHLVAVSVPAADASKSAWRCL